MRSPNTDQHARLRCENDGFIVLEGARHPKSTLQMA
jgi:hypothetical protein